MILYKNVDINDLRSIIKKGIVPLDECGTNWEDGNRADNRTDVVYLFSPIDPEKCNSFVNYGLALLKVEIDFAEENKILQNDANNGRYKEYIIDRVQPDQIKAIYIPECFQKRIFELDKCEKLFPNYSITWCPSEWAEWDRPFTKERFEIFANTAPLFTTCFNYLRGEDEKRHLIDISKNVIYKI